MPLNQQQITRLRQAIAGYAFPAVYFDFNKNVEIVAHSMTQVEIEIASQLRSVEAIKVKHGLANILYWGYAQIGYRGNRIEDFVSSVSGQQVHDFQTLLKVDSTPKLVDVRRVHMPQYSGMSFVSKILMFLDPDDYCVLDQQLAKLRSSHSQSALNRLTFGKNETQIRITNQNETVYDEWRNECLAISQKYFDGRHRVVDIERGFFSLIQQRHLSDAQAIYNAA